MMMMTVSDDWGAGNGEPRVRDGGRQGAGGKDGQGGRCGEVRGREGQQRGTECMGREPGEAAGPR